MTIVEEVFSIKEFKDETNSRVHWKIDSSILSHVFDFQSFTAEITSLGKQGQILVLIREEMFRRNKKIKEKYDEQGILFGKMFSFGSVKRKVGFRKYIWVDNPQLFDLKVKRKLIFDEIGELKKKDEEKRKSLKLQLKKWIKDEFPDATEGSWHT